MNNMITEKKIKRKALEYEKRMQRIIENEQKERERCRDLKFELVGILNMFDIVPDFVIPIFTCVQDAPDDINKKYYFQVGSEENDTLISFSELENYGKYYKERVIKLCDSNSYSGVLFSICSKPLYAFQISQTDLFFGNYLEMKKFLEEYETEDNILREEILDFLQLESKNIWERVRNMLEKCFPDDSADEIEKKYRTLRNTDFEGKTSELYVPEFQGSILRVGIRVKGENKKAYFSTEIGEQLEDIILD